MLFNYGRASVGSHEESYKTPTLSDYGNWGSNFSVKVLSGTTVGSYYYWKAFDGVECDYSSVVRLSGTSVVTEHYYPVPIKPTAVRYYTVQHSSYAYSPIGVTVYGSNDETNWTSLGTCSHGKENQALRTCTCTADTFYSYLKFSWKPGDRDQVGLFEIFVDATYVVPSQDNITFPCAYTTTNYAYSLAYLDGKFGGSYASNKTITGMLLHNESTADYTYYMTLGY